jgi:hypothetical protein
MLEDYRAGLGVDRDHEIADRQGHRVESGHHMAEEAPEDLALALRDFLGRPADPPSR